jgi:hypothetical protein
MRRPTTRPPDFHETPTMPNGEPPRTACLLGNGVSIAYNGDLAVDKLTGDLLTIFRNAGATNPGRALGAFADVVSAAGADAAGTFEALLGPLESSADALTSLDALAPLVEASQVAHITTSLHDVRDFMRAVHRLGIATTLRHIADRSIGGAFNEVATTLGQALIDLGAPSALSVATLNYDGLLHAGIMDAGNDEYGQPNYEITDLAYGADDGTFVVAPGHAIVAHPIRDVDNLLPDRASLLQLHGSLGWLKSPNPDGAVWRFPLQQLRDADYWNAWADGDSQWDPVVVLTDRKDRAVGAWPFSLAYDIFQRKLSNADRWLIAGYGLGDRPVNVMYDGAVERVHRDGRPVPPTLVIGRGGDPDEVTQRVSSTLRIPPARITVCLDGVPDALTSDQWNQWAS